MFENVIAQDSVVQRLKEELSKQTLPGSLMFYGNQNSGKMTTALELARVLTCSDPSAPWDCGCQSCRQQRTLSHPYTIILGSRYGLDEIQASADVLLRLKEPFSQYMFVRAVRKLTRRFDPLLWEGNEPRFKKIQSDLELVSELLEQVWPGKKIPGARELKSTLGKITKSCAKIAGSSSSENIPIEQIRRVNYWAHTSSGGSRKVIILDNADRMMDSSRNSILKILEEPPKDVFFILLTTKKGAIIETIQSRVRPFHFKSRTEEDAKEVLNRIFREDSHQYKSLDQFFLAWRDVNVENLQTEIDNFLLKLIERNLQIPEDVQSLYDTVLNGNIMKPFLELLSEECRKLVHSGLTREKAVSLKTLEQWNRIIRQTVTQKETLNQSNAGLLEALVYKMMEAL